MSGISDVIELPTTHWTVAEETARIMAGRLSPGWELEYQFDCVRMAHNFSIQHTSHFTWLVGASIAECEFIMNNSPTYWADVITHQLVGQLRPRTAARTDELEGISVAEWEER